jgi:uncharacterized protein DUF4349/putative zinc finger protein
MNKRDRFMEPEEIMAYLDGELSTDRAAIAAEHLKECHECQNLAGDLREVSQALMTWEIAAPEIAMSSEIAGAFATKGEKRTQPAVRTASFPVWPKIFSLRGLAWTGGVVVAAFLLLVISTPTLLKSREGAERAAQMARERQRTLDQSRVAGDSVTGSGPPQSTAGALESYSYNGAAANDKSGATGKLDKNSLATYANAERGESFALTFSSDASNFTGAGTGNVEKFQVPQVRLPAGNTGATTVATGPMIIHTAQITLSTKDFEKTRAGVEDTLKRHNGYVGQMNVTTPTGGARMLNATLRIPASQLESTLAELKALGRVEAESQGGEEVTQRYVDLEARLANARNSEVRLTQILQRAGKLSDVLSVEEQIETVRGQIEEMQAEKKTLSNQIDFATLTATVTEVYKEQLQVVPNATSTRFRNAAVEGYRTMVDGIVSLLLFLISVAPTLLLWTAILFFPVRWAWPRLKKKLAQQEAETHHG